MASPTPRHSPLPVPPQLGVLGPGPYSAVTAQGMIGSEDFVSESGDLTPAAYRFLASVFAALLKVGGGPITTVARLPPPAGYQGIHTFVSDSSVNAWGVPVAGGGAIQVPVFCDGTAWRVG